VNCLSYRCGHCGPRLALATVAAIELAGPHSSMVFTFRSSLSSRDPRRREDFVAFNDALKRLTHRVRSEGYEWEAAWIVEVSPRGIPHVHLLQSGSKVPLTKLMAAANEAGFSWAQAQPIRHLRTIARYVLKAPLRGLDLPLTQATQAMHHHLGLNGGWLMRYTGQFWRAPDGRILRGVRLARMEAMNRLRDPSQGSKRAARRGRLREFATHLSPTLGELSGPGGSVMTSDPHRIWVTVRRRHRWVVFVKHEITETQATEVAAGKPVKPTSAGETSEPVCFWCEETVEAAASSCPGSPPDPQGDC
jgi:hypothetical protein